MVKSINVVSFGFLHSTLAESGVEPHLKFDLRRHFRDPHVTPELRYLDASDARVRRAVRDTAGIPSLTMAIVKAAAAYTGGPSGGDVVVAIGCAGGRHRAPVVAHDVTAELRRRGYSVNLWHLDGSKDVVER